MSTNLTTTTSTTSTSPTTTTSMVQAVPQTPQPASSSSLLDVMQSIFSRIMSSDTTTSTSSASLTTTTSVVQVAPQQQIAQPGFALDRLPYEILHHIFSFMRVKDLHPLLLTCKYTHTNILTDDGLWKKFLKKYLPSCSLEGVTNFVELYKNADAGLKNMRQKKYRETDFKVNDEFTTPAVSTHSGWLVSRFDESIIICKDDNNDIKQVKCIPVTKGLEVDIEFGVDSGVQFQNNDILAHKNYVFYSIENGVVAYDIEADKELYTIQFNPPQGRGLLPRVARDGYLLCTTNNWYGNKGIKVFEIESGKEILSIDGPYCINGVEMKGQNLFASLVIDASERSDSQPEKNRLIQVVDFVHNKEVNRFHKPYFVPGTMVMNANEVYCASVTKFLQDSIIVVLDAESGEMRRIIKTALPTIRKIYPFDGMLLINTIYGVQLLDLENGNNSEVLSSYQTGGTNKSTISNNHKLYWGIGTHKGGFVRVFDFSPPSSANIKQPVIEVVEEEKDDALGLFSFLVDFGIASRTDIYNKLKCTSKDLQNLNIVSEQDLSSIGIRCSNVEKLPLTMPISNNGAPQSQLQQIQQIQGQAKSRHEELSTFLKKLIDQIHQRIEESCHEPALYGDNNPWFNLSKECDQYRIMFYDIEHRSAKEFLNEFSAEGYQAKAKFINDCVDKFNALDKEHQIAKFRVYIERQRQGN